MRLIVPVVLAAGLIDATARGAAAETTPSCGAWRIVDLGTLPGGTFSQATGVDDAGEVFGGAQDAVGTRAVRWDRHLRPTELAAPATAESSVNAASAGGSAAGWVRTGSVLRAARWDTTGRLTELPPLPGNTSSYAFGVNDRGMVAGVSDTGTTSRAVVWNDRGRPTALDLLPNAQASWASGINDKAEIVGEIMLADWSAHAVRWDAAGHVADLGTVPDARGATAAAISDYDTIIGQALLSDGELPVRWDRLGRILVLPTRSGSQHTVASGINKHKMIVGGDEHNALLWNHGGEPVALDDLPGGRGGEGIAINAHGLVAGVAFTADATTHAALWRCRP